MKSLSLLTNSQKRARHDARSQRSSRTFPRTDYHFHAPAEDVVAVRDQRQTASREELRAFRHLSNEYLGAESTRGFIFESIVLAMIVCIVVFPVVAMLIAYARIS